MSRRCFSVGTRPESSLCLILAYAFFVLFSPAGQDALPKGAQLRYQAHAPESDAGAAVQSAVAGGIWIDDEQDACHSSPANRKQDDAAPFALLDLESPVRKGAAAAPPLPFHFPYAADIAFRPIPAGVPAAAHYRGPSLPFAERFPAFLISALPPPLSA